MSDTKAAKDVKDPKGITISVMGREFRVAAPDGEASGNCDSGDAGFASGQSEN